MIEEVRQKEKDDIEFLLSIGFHKIDKNGSVSYYLDGINIRQCKAWSDYKRYPTIYFVDGESNKNDYDFDGLLLNYLRLDIDRYENFKKLKNRQRVIDKLLNHEEPVEYRFKLPIRWI